jgi:hypothetical protein
VQRAITALSGDAFEIILDYKGMRRPSTTIADPQSLQSKQPNPAWEHYVWQVMTYAWLRAQQPDSAPVVAGILLFVNELEPSSADMEELQEDVNNYATDIMPNSSDLRAITAWKPGQSLPTLSTSFREQRSIRIVAIDPDVLQQSLTQFDAVVKDIEDAVLQEMSSGAIFNSWQARPSGAPYIAPEKRTCTACDFKYYCPLASQVGEGGAPAAP